MIICGSDVCKKEKEKEKKEQMENMFCVNYPWESLFA